MSNTEAQKVFIRAQGERLMDPELIAALERRYANTIDEPVPVNLFDPINADHARMYANLCDAVIQLFWPEHYGTGPDDPLHHTSEPARKAAYVLLLAAGWHPVMEGETS